MASSIECHELQSLLKQLMDVSPSSDNPNANKARDLVIDVSEFMSSEFSSIHHEFFISLLLNKDGLVKFCKDSIKHQEFGDAKKSTLEIIKTLTLKDPKYVGKYATDILSMSLFLYRVDKAAKVRCSALELFYSFLSKVPLDTDTEYFDFPKTVDQLCIGINSPKTPSVVQHELIALGSLTSALPHLAKKKAPFIFKVLVAQLAKHTGQRPDLTILAGSLRGLAFYLRNFPDGEHYSMADFSNIYSHVHKIINPNLNLPKRDSQRAGLSLLAEHGAKFSQDLLGKYDTLFPWFVKWCTASNRDDFKAGCGAMDTFLTVIANKLQLDHSQENKKALIYFTKQFNGLLESDSNSSMYLVNVAVKGYGALAPACKEMLAQSQLEQLFSGVLNASYHAIYQSDDLIDTKLAHLPTYLQSISSLIVQMPEVDCSSVQRITTLLSVLIEHYPMLESYKQYSAHSAVVMLLAPHSDVILTLRRTFIHHAIMQSCSHLSPMEVDQLGTETQARDRVTYKSYLPLWKTLLSQNALVKLKTPGVRLNQVSSELFNLFISSVKDIITKLDLTTRKEVKDEEGTECSNPVEGVVANTPKDFQVYTNLVALVCDVLSHITSEDDNNIQVNAVEELLRYILPKASTEHLVASHYLLIDGLLQSLGDYFQTSQCPKDLLNLVVSFSKDVCERCKQFSDHLLASSLSLLLNLPLSVSTRITTSLVQPMQIAMVMGLSYPPVGLFAVLCLCKWSHRLSLSDDVAEKLELRKALSEVLPKVLPYLTSRESDSSELQSRTISVKMSLINQHRRVDVRKLKASKVISQSSISTLQNIQQEIIRLLGNLDTDLCDRIGSVSGDELADMVLRWDKHRHVPFKVPYKSDTLDLYLDPMLPRIVHLALNSTDRQTKVAASELLHSVVIILIAEGRTSLHTAAPLYRRIFSACLRLACDPDHVSRQLFLTLMMQCIHFFTNNKGYENPDTAALLTAIMEGLEDTHSPSLRDTCAKCLLEFLSWSRKQAKNDNSTHTNVKSVLKRILYLLCHPSAYKRIGGCLAFNSIYRELREDAKVIDVWLWEILSAIVTCFIFCDSDDPALKSGALTLTAFNHLVKIIELYNNSLNKVSSERRLPEVLHATEGTVKDVCLWLLTLTSHPAQQLRHSVTERMSTLVTCVEGHKTLPDFVRVELLEQSKTPLLLECLDHSIRGHALSVTSVDGTLGEVTLEHLMSFVKKLLASLECFSMLLSGKVVPIEVLLEKGTACLLTPLKFFIEHLARVDSFTDYLMKLNLTEEETSISLSTNAKMVELKCSLIVRLMDFTELLLMKSDRAFSMLSRSGVLGEAFYKLFVDVVLTPSDLGFNLGDSSVGENLVGRMSDIFKSFNSTLNKTEMDRLMIILDQKLASNDISNLIVESIDTVGTVQLLTAFLTLFGSDIVKERFGDEAKVYADCLFSYSSNILFPLKSSKGSNTLNHSTALEFTKIALQLNPLVLKSLLTKWFEDGSTVISHSLAPILLPHLPEVSAHCSQLVGQRHLVVRLQLSLTNHLLRNAQDRKKYCSILISHILSVWDTVSHLDGTVNDNDLLALLTALFLIDSKDVLSSHIVNEENQKKEKSLLNFWCDIIKGDKIALRFKLQALKLLPFFYKLSDTIQLKVTDSLKVLKALHLPLRSKEFPLNSSKDREYKELLVELLTAFQLTGAPRLLKFIALIFCKEESHQHLELLQDHIQKVNFSSNTLEKILFEMYSLVQEQTDVTSQQYRLSIVKELLTPLMSSADVVCLEKFFVRTIKEVLSDLAQPLPSKSDEQMVQLSTKLSCFSIIQILYAKLSRAQVFSSTSAVNAAFKPDDATGKELTKEVLRRTVRIAKGDYRHDSTHKELRRQCACAAYNTLVSVIVTTQDDLKFYTNFLFTENKSKGELLWASLIDTEKLFVFETEVNFKPGSKGRFINIQKIDKKVDSEDYYDRKAEYYRSMDPTVRMFGSNFYNDSSLREDLSQYDFSSAIVLTVGEQHSQKSNEGQLVELQLDSSDFNEHEAMGCLSAAILHMHNSNIATAPSGDGNLHLPAWISSLVEKLADEATPRNVKLFLLRLIFNTQQVFAPYSSHLVNAILRCIGDGTVGSGINYFLADMIVMLVSWNSDKLAASTDKHLLTKVITKLVNGIPHTRADVFKYNVELFRTLIAVYSSVVTSDGDEISDLIERKESATREVEAGLHVAACFLVNGLLPYKLDYQVTRLFKALVSAVGDRKATVYNSAAEVTGLLLKRLYQKEKEDLAIQLMNDIEKTLNSLFNQAQSQALSCLNNIHKHCPQATSRFSSKLLNFLPRLYGLQKFHALECLVEHIAAKEEGYRHLSHCNIKDLIGVKEPTTQLVALKVIKALLPVLTLAQLKDLLPSVSNLARHSSPSCREVVYNIHSYVYQKYKNSTDEEQRILFDDAKDCLLMAVNDDDTELRDSLLNVWTSPASELNPSDLLLYVVKDLYSCASENTYLTTACHVLMQSSKASHHYTRPIYEQPLTQCKFFEMHVSPAWQARHASMVPLFSSSQMSDSEGESGSSLSTYVAMTQNADLGENFVKATQEKQFSATQIVNFDHADSTFVGSTIQESELDLVALQERTNRTPSQGSSSGLVFSTSKSHGVSQSKSGLGRSKMKPRISEDQTDSTNTNSMSQLVKRRFVKQQDRGKQSMHFAKLEERRRKMQEIVKVERRKRREAQVTMLREYRVGELPDIQISHKSVIDPLQALAQRDVTIARHLLTTVATAVIESEKNFESHDALVHLNRLIGESVSCPPHLIRASIEILLKGQVDFDAEAITQVCVGSRQEMIGILLFENLILKVEKNKNSEPPRKKQRPMKVEVSTSNYEVNKLYLNLAELYGSLGMNDVVRGILSKGAASNLHHHTYDALQAESLNQPKKAYDAYLQALANPATGNIDLGEQRIWEERICVAASVLGLWEDLETFVENRFLADPSTGVVSTDNVWKNPRPSSVVLPSLVNSKIMNLLLTPDSKGDVVDFVNLSLQDPMKRQILEDNLSPQIALLSIYQEKLETSRLYLDTSKRNLLDTLSQQSVLSPKSLGPMFATAKLLIEMGDYLDLQKLSEMNQNKREKIMNMCSMWQSKLSDNMNDKVLVQTVTSYRDLYSHFLEKECVDEVNVLKDIHKTQAMSYSAVIELSLQNENIHLATRYLKKLDTAIRKYDLAREFSVKLLFLQTQAAILRGTQQSASSSGLKYLVEGWCRYLGKVSTSGIDDANHECDYMKWEARICQGLCSTLRNTESSYDPENQYLKVLSSKFPEVRIEKGSEAWYPSLLECSYSNLVQYASKSTEVKNADYIEAYDKLAKFCNESLEKFPEYIDKVNYQKTFIMSTLKGMTLGSSVSHHSFPRLIHLLDENSSLSAVFDSNIDSVPTWMFLLWIPHILIYVDKNPGKSLHPLIIRIAETYPQAVFYPFNVSKSDYDFETKVGRSAFSVCEKVEKILQDKCAIMYKFLDSMLLIKEPMINFKLSLNRLNSKSDADKKKELQSIYSGLSGEISSFEDPTLVGTSKEFGDRFRVVANRFRKVFNEQFGDKFQKLGKLKGDKLKFAIGELLKSWNTIQNLRMYSPWLANFQASHTPEILEIPGQYSGLSKPLMQYHIKISNFDNNLKVMPSLRKPIVITMHGSDEKTYKYLVKTGEDLRTDQRMEMLFGLMNNMYDNSKVTKELSSAPNLTTFSVVPLSKDAGMLQWVDSTMQLKEFMEEAATEEEKEGMKLASGLYGDLGSEDLLKLNSRDCVRRYTKCVEKLPCDLLKRSLFDLSSDYESFFKLRTNFLSSHSTICVSQWLLGIGDRHLSNFLVEVKTAKMVGIDFGHHFESATQFLPHPELIPFRLTPQIENVSKPLGYHGVIRETMVGCLQTLTDNKDVILAAVEAFVKEPTKDWIDFVKRQEGSSSSSEIEDYSAGKIDIICSKLEGVNPCNILATSMKRNKSPYLPKKIKEQLSEIIYGSGEIRSEFNSSQTLSVPQQVDVLLDVATDPNILGRTYWGWSPWA